MSASDPLVSVVIPSYNHAAFIGEAIASVAAQEEVAIELIVVDDGSKDGSPALIAKLFERFDRGRCELVVQANQGAHAAINRGLGMARGEYLQILNSDDRLTPRRCVELMATLRPSDDLAFTAVQVIDELGRAAAEQHVMHVWYRSAMQIFEAAPSVGWGLLAINAAVTTSNFFFRKRLLDRTGPFTPERLCHDWRFLLKALPWTEPVFVPQPLLDYRFHGGNTAPRVMDLRRSEGETALREYLVTIERTPPLNRLAPSPYWWPGVYGSFLRSRSSWFADERIAAFAPQLLDLT